VPAIPRALVILICSIDALTCRALAAPGQPASPASRPASAPASAPSTETLADGLILFVPPDGWTQAAKAPNGRTIAYIQTRQPKATMAVNADHQPSPLDAVAAEKIGQMQCKRIVENAQKSNIQILDQPQVEKDERFFLRIHHRFKKGDTVGDQLQLYRPIHHELVAVAVTAYTDSPEQAKTVFDDAEKVMISVRAAGGDAAAPTSAPSAKAPQLAAKPITLGQAKIRLSPPEGWRAEINDAASGMVATFRDPADRTNLVAVSVRPMPKEARTDPKLRDALIQEMASGETAQFKLDGAEPVGQTMTLVDRRFLHKARTRYHVAAQKAADNRQFDISTRQLRAGDELVSVTTVSLQDSYETLDKLADQVALSVRAASAAK
jgi:hypothetical protein